AAPRMYAGCKNDWSMQVRPVKVALSPLVVLVARCGLRSLPRGIAIARAPAPAPCRALPYVNVGAFSSPPSGRAQRNRGGCRALLTMTRLTERRVAVRVLATPRRDGRSTGDSSHAWHVSCGTNGCALPVR